MMEDDEGGEPLSLSQLIYSQSSPAVPLPAVSHTPISSFKGIKKEDDLIHDFYGIERKEKATATPRKKRKRLDRWSRAEGDDAWEMKLETQSEAEERERRNAVYRQLEVTQRLWKKRRVDVRDEEDVGGVYENLVRKHWRKVVPEPTISKECGEETVVEPSFWMQGRSAPDEVEGIPRPYQSTIKKRNDLPREESVINPFPLKRHRVDETRQVFQLRQHTTMLHTNGPHFHQGTLARLAARYLIASPSKDEAQANWLLRNLFQIDHKRRSDAVLWQASELGLNAKVFFENRWTDRSNAALKLGISCQASQSAQSILYSTDHGSIKKKGVELRGRVLHSMKKTTVTSQQLEDNNEIESISQGDFESGNESKISFHTKSGLSTEEGNNQDGFSFEGTTQGDFMFVYRQNSIPPVPNFPLDQVGVVFGSEDQHSQAARLGKIQSSTSDITFSTLLARLTAAMQSGDDAKSYGVHNSLMAFLDLLVKENAVNLVGIKNRRGVVNADLYDVSEYDSLMQYVSYLMNRPCAPAKIDKVAESDSHVEIEDIGAANRAKYDSIVQHVNHYAEETSLFLSKVRGREGLDHFPRVHLVYALSLVACELPPAAADIFSIQDENPFCTVRKTLEFLEKNCMLVELSSEYIRFKTIMHAHLEHVFHQAALVVEKRCVRNSDAIEYGAWLSALQLGSVLLCSGVMIGTAAFPHPSFRKTRVRLDSYFSQDGKKGNLPHEVRRKLAKFDEARLEAATGIRKFLDDFESLGPRVSQLIVTALEWSQVIALMVGPIRKNDISSDTRWAHIRILHSRHLVKSLNIQATQLEKLKVTDGIQKDDILGKLASDVENTPSDIGTWRRLCDELGPIARAFHRKGEQRKKGVPGDNVRSESKTWWGNKRNSWWKEYLLVLPKVNISYLFPGSVFAIGELIEQKVPKPVHLEVAECSDVSTKITCEWLDRTIKSIRKTLDADRSNHGPAEGDDLKKQKTKVLKELGPEVRSISLDEYLPQPLPSQELCDRPVSATQFSAGLANVSEALEICCYKIVILAHLYGWRDKSVRDGIWFLARRAVKKGDDETWDCLSHLSRYGFDIARLVMDIYTQVVRNYNLKKKMSKKVWYSNDQKAAFQLGYACFGSNIALIRDNVPEFASWDYEKVRQLYHILERSGELSNVNI